MIATYITREETGDGFTPVRLSLVEGAVYRFKGIEGKSGEKRGWVVPPGDYVLVGVAKHVHSNQDVVVYRCLADGRLFVCTLSDWDQKFEVPKAPPVPQPSLTPVKVAGTHLPNGAPNRSDLP